MNALFFIEMRRFIVFRTQRELLIEDGYTYPVGLQYYVTDVNGVRHIEEVI